MSTGKPREITRLEGFSDAVFGFALTLLVVSLEVPGSYQELVTAMRGFVPFACCFAIVVWIWYEHCLFFQRYSLQDGITVVLNALLLFVVLFYVYPLKFVFGLIPQLLRIAPLRPETREMTQQDATNLMIINGVGFVLVFGILALMHAHALRRRERTLTELELFDARAAIRRHVASIGVGLTSIVAAAAIGAPQGAGLVYFLLGPVHFALGLTGGRRRAALAERLSSAA